MGRIKREKPNEVSARWPRDPLDDPTYESVRKYVQNLAKAIEGKSLREAAEVTGVPHSTLADILRGQVWPDAITVARTENGLKMRLWDGPAAPPKR